MVSNKLDAGLERCFFCSLLFRLKLKVDEVQIHLRSVCCIISLSLEVTRAFGRGERVQRTGKQ